MILIHFLNEKQLNVGAIYMEIVINTPVSMKTRRITLLQKSFPSHHTFLIIKILNLLYSFQILIHRLCIE